MRLHMNHSRKIKCELFVVILAKNFKKSKEGTDSMRILSKPMKATWWCHSKGIKIQNSRRNWISSRISMMTSKTLSQCWLIKTRRSWCRTEISSTKCQRWRKSTETNLRLWCFCYCSVRPKIAPVNRLFCPNSSKTCYSPSPNPTTWTEMVSKFTMRA